MWKRYALLMTAPSITTPEVTYFQSATSSLGANATTVVFFVRPPLPEAGKKIDAIRKEKANPEHGRAVDFRRVLAELAWFSPSSYKSTTDDAG